mmetsp:Transcript_12727/g.14883  ORF Transcript_12727/g.14883 Transcript_12727/m.14883 type:complete len:209 (+) Transcript_12727:141-767(+)|eukprot:Skav204201  [mRNA]  locus=scaffold985:23670:34533:- [translate_table: standard]
MSRHAVGKDVGQFSKWNALVFGSGAGLRYAPWEAAHSALSPGAEVQTHRGKAAAGLPDGFEGPVPTAVRHHLDALHLNVGLDVGILPVAAQAVGEAAVAVPPFVGIGVLQIHQAVRKDLDHLGVVGAPIAQTQVASTRIADPATLLAMRTLEHFLLELWIGGALLQLVLRGTNARLPNDRLPSSLHSHGVACLDALSHFSLIQLECAE